MAPTQVIRDPDEISTNDPVNDEALVRKGNWQPAELFEMDAAFIAAMARAGYEVTAPSSRPGTQRPLLGYRRADT
jgi:hypothetical protein